MTINMLYYLKVSAVASVHTLVSTVHTLNQHRLQTQPCRKNGSCKTSKRACAKTNIFGYFQSDVVYVKLEEFEVIHGDTY